ncbi:hypothetical protein VNI00_016936 [Paramarasmius palmivorus]|uniref:CxC2-like cysteine cluster KDZ transposase-associated domain-containing protein n=1 Tax=Paramarasmius palmivorus TaxID=297713 RepID=A0AAW0BA19_9AGAR
MGKRKRMVIHYGGEKAVDGQDVIQRAGMDGLERRWSQHRSRHESLFNALTFQQRESHQAPETPNTSTADNDIDNNSDNEPFPEPGDAVEYSSIPMYDPLAPDDQEWRDIPPNSERPPTFPPGDEAAVMSHEGGEYGYHNFLRSFQTTRLSDSRVRTDRIEKQVKSWRDQLPHLVDAYLAFKADGPPQNHENQPEWDVQVMDFNCKHDTGQRTLFHISADVYSANQTLLRHGYIGASPQIISIAFPLSLFHTYRQIHRVCNRFSIDALSKALQHIHYLPRDRHLEDQLRLAYDAYLMIVREVNKRCTDALGRQSRQAFFGTMCAPCRYSVKDEIPLVPSMLVAIDGNNSLKMVDENFKFGSAREDTRQLPDLRWVEDDEVDKFKDEVNNAQSKRGAATQSSNVIEASDAVYPDLDPANEKEGDVAWLNVNETKDLEACIDTCVDRWRNAGPESRKKMFAFFAVSGVFLAVCRHGHLLAMCDMRKSGELMKYPLAIVDRLMEDFGLDLCVAYDIMCAFFKTMRRSELVGNKIVKMRLKGVVPAFHGHAHNRKCQLSWHPLYILGVGLEDFEECERAFSRSNHLASITRLATWFHRRQAILEHFYFNDEDKHASIGNFIYQSYRRALRRLQEDKPVYGALLKQQGLSSETCEELLKAEREHFENRVFPEPPEMAEAIEYAELLEHFWETKAKAETAHEAYLAMTRDRNTLPEQRTALHTRDQTAYSRFKTAQEELLRFEDEHPRDRWTRESSEYQDALKHKVNRKYRRALENLERVVVQRLFELTKLNMSSVGYKQRDKITHALRARSEAIRKALLAYNAIALQMQPRKPTLAWHEVISMVTLAEFDLLKDTHLDLSNTPWADIHKREAVRLHFSILRAQEEIIRLNVELKRLITFMIDDHADYQLAIQRLMECDRPLAEELRRRSEYQSRLHTRIAERLVQTSELPGFSGDLTPGERVDRDPHLTDSVQLPEWAAILGLQRSGDPDITTEHVPDNSGSDSEEEEGAEVADGLETFWEGM